jgi:hypothetical protein
MDTQRVGQLHNVVGPIQERSTRLKVREAVPRAIDSSGWWNSRPLGVPGKKRTGRPDGSPYSAKPNVRPSASVTV